ncbi:TonB-dependent receptor [Acidicapsa ligni]|uniref:TonB-dependent receptor n=1 Tax=Acidicapsa ligni TaxID=542300 RepID=UPI0021DF7F2E|nr:carboxypeptidase-like regulatory domain-containing protein [Acidicapsa ligni]
MTTTHFRRFAAGTLLAIAAVLYCCAPALAQQTLGSINGTVLDASGAAVPNATVTVINTQISLSRTAKSQGNGFFQVFNLPIGTYDVKITGAGFETTDENGITVQEARATTIDVRLKIGQASESVEVTANPLLNATDATNGYTLDAGQIAETPLATGSFTQLAVLSPGVNAELLSGLDSNSGLGNQPIWANGQRDTSNTMQVNGVDVTNIFNGKTSSSSTSQRYNFNIGAGSTSGSSSAGTGVTGGANPTGTSVFGSNGNSLPSPVPETIEEVRVNTSMYDAQQGATSGAQIDVNTKTGTNAFHGQIYGTFANNALNASPFFFNQAYQLGTEGIGAFPRSLQNPELHRWTTGATVGGPLFRDKLFFFAGYQRRYNSDQATGLSQMTVPTGLTDDRSVAGLDAAAASWGNGKAFTGTIGPIASSLLNAKLPNGQYLIPSAQGVPGAPYQFGVPNVTLIGTSVLTSDQGTGSLTYTVNPKDNLSVKYYYQSDPVQKPFGYSQTGGFPITQDNGSQVGAIDNTIAFSSRLNWEQRLGFVRMNSYSHFTQTVVNPNGGSNFGIGDAAPSTAPPLAPGLPGLLLSGFANTQVDSPGLKVGPFSSFADMGYTQNRVNPSTNLILSLGKHTIKAGGGYNYTQLNIDNNRSGLAQITTKNFTSFLEDAVKSSNVLESIDPISHRNTADRYYRSNEIAAYVVDNWQAMSNLSITVSARYDYKGGLTEKYGNMFNFDQSLFDVSGTTDTGFTVNNAGFVVASNNKYFPTKGESESTLSGRQWGISPRVGFAWSPKANQGRVVFSGGAGMYYDRGELFNYLSQPAGSGTGGPFGVTESSPLASYIVGKGTNLSNPLNVSYAAPSADPSVIGQALQATLNGMTGNSAKFGKNCGAVDNQEGYTDCPDALNFGAYNKRNVLPYTINYTLKFQWQPRNDISFSLGYVGNLGRHAVIPVPLNEPGIATSSNPIHGETGTYGFQVLNQNSFTGFDYNSIAGEPWNTEDGGNTDFRVPFVGFSPNAAIFTTAGNSSYNDLEAHLEKRLSHHVQAGISYTWSHSLDEQSDIGLFFTGNNPNNLKQSYASSDFDRTQVFIANFQVETPDFVRRSSPMAYIANGWHLTGIGVIQSGEPYSLYEFYGAVGSAYFGDFPTLSNPVLSIKDPSHPKRALTGNSGAFRGSGGSFIPHIDPTQLAINYLAPGQKGVPVSTGNDPQDIYETDFAPGNQRNIFRQAGQERLDLSMRKSFHPTTKLVLQYEFNVFNVTNRTSLDVPQNQTQIRQASACSNSAKMNGDNCSTSEYFVNFGQIVTSNSSVDQQSSKTNLDQLPFANGSGRGTTIPTTLPVGVGSCSASGSVGNGCPNNGANFGSVTGTIGGSRAVTMGLHVTF